MNDNTLHLFFADKFKSCSCKSSSYSFCQGLTSFWVPLYPEVDLQFEVLNFVLISALQCAKIPECKNGVVCTGERCQT